MVPHHDVCEEGDMGLPNEGDPYPCPEDDEFYNQMQKAWKRQLVSS
jgi:hypothetical protein